MNFEPKWGIKTDLPLVQEGTVSTSTIYIQKNNSNEPNNEYKIQEHQYIEIEFKTSRTGETFEARDIEILIGENVLYPIETIDPNNPSKLGSYKFILNSNEFILLPNEQQSVITFKIKFLQNGVWNTTETYSIELVRVSVISTIDGQISNIEPSGVIGDSLVTIVLNSSNEIWCTPDLTVRGELYTIGEIGYGEDSTIFVQAFGQSSSTEPRVYVPMYQLQTFEPSEIPSEHITNISTYFTPDQSQPQNEFQKVLIKDEVGNNVQSGLSFLSNGQLLLTFLYQSEPCDCYMKVKIVPMDFYEPIGMQFYKGKKFRAYQTWIAPLDVSGFAEPKPEAGHVYLLNNTSVYPYTADTVMFNGSELLNFDPLFWKDMGLYDPSLGDGIVGSEKIFRVLVNASESTGIEFETDENLGNVHVGEYFGHSIYSQIKATGSDLITYTILKTSRDNINKYNIILSPDGYIQGKVYAQSSDFSANDDIKLEFDVLATAKDGKTKTKTFKLRIIRGLSEHTMSAEIIPSINLERNWFDMIGSSTFSKFNYYRQSDARYGLISVPRILLKENLVSSDFNWISLEDTKEQLRNGIIDTITGSPVPNKPFGLVLGNYKVRSALDNNGNVLYDVLYREIFSEGTIVELQKNSTEYNSSSIDEFYGLRANITKILKSDVQNLLTDPDDFINRGLVVPAIDGISPEIIDTVPRFMNHPYEGTGAEPEIFACAVVAYLLPGTGEKAFNELMKSQEHSKLLGFKFDIQSVLMKYFNTESSIYTEDSFVISIKNENLML